MITNVDYLIQKYAEAREKKSVYTGSSKCDQVGFNYWRGVMDTYHNLLSTAFEGWAEPGSVGHYVFNELMTYDEALNHVEGILK